MDESGQTLLELVAGLGLLALVISSLAIITMNNLQNTQLSKNQVQATKLAQENIEKVRAIKNGNFGICTQSGGSNPCFTWDDIWATQFGSAASCTTVGCTYKLINGCTVSTGGVKPFCLSYIDPAVANRADLGNGFTGVVIIEDEAASQKRVTSRVFWSDTSGEHSSDLVTILSRI